ncbi:MAG: cellulase family glycosylhydrolase [Oscillospiraceae bacterium]|nr:cellulase family glycosylhydrolase [Oscillospiraceae bacterium]
MLLKKGFRKGVNLGGWLSQCDYSAERLAHFITESDFATIAAWGMDHVRIPMDYNVLEDENGGYEAAGYERIDWALEQCRLHGLNVVLDLHKTAGFSFDEDEREEGFFHSAAYQERFYRLWETLAQRYGKYADTVVFELLNEVTDPSFIDAWNRIANECIKRIRPFAPDTLILVGSYHNNSAPAVKDLAPPYDDKVIYNFHCYEPLSFTHQGATWAIALNPADRFSFEESNCTTDYFEALFAPAIAAAEQHHTVLYCGEYGMIDIVSPEDTLKWFQTIHTVFERHNIARCAWNYKEMDFGLSDARLDGIREELLRYL